jgi:hypothetical protein
LACAHPAFRHGSARNSPRGQARRKATHPMGYSSSRELPWRYGLGLLTGSRSFSKNNGDAQHITVILEYEIS